MSANPLSKSVILMVVLVVAAITSWELYLRGKGIDIAYDDEAPLWSDKRAMVYEPTDKSTVFIGSSRIKFDLDVDTWEKMTGDHAILLALEGSNPLPILHDLANDEKFKGKLIVDVTEPLCFIPLRYFQVRPETNIKYYHDRTPAQRASFSLNYFLESRFVFLDKMNFSLGAQLDKLKIENRPGVYLSPEFPMDFSRVQFSRQCKMTDRFVADTNLQNQVKAVWASLRIAPKGPPPPEAQINAGIQATIQSIKNDVTRIRARGGQIVFVRTPASGPLKMGEEMGFPRKNYWDRILNETGSVGIHYLDYPSLDHFVCPEFSHLSPKDAGVFTQHLIRILNEEMGWKFPKLPGSLTFTR
ncbi:MAG TPA: hypothetical protein VKA49_11335 [Flavitalea sp.]|nr:hypothetical protein [Flavitalea sp.]